MVGGMVWHGMVRVRHGSGMGMAWHGRVWHGMVGVWHDIVGMAWHGMSKA